MAGYGSAPHNYPPEIAKDQQLLIVSPIWPLIFWWLPFYWRLLYPDRMIIHKPVGTFAMYFACLGLHVPETFLGSVGPATSTRTNLLFNIRLTKPYLFQIDGWLFPWLSHSAFLSFSITQRVLLTQVPPSLIAHSMTEEWHEQKAGKQCWTWQWQCLSEELSSGWFDMARGWGVLSVAASR